MNWIDVEKAFQRAFLLSFSRKRLFLTFPVLVLCGLLTVFCKAVAFNASDWISLSLGFLPIFLSSGLLLGLGVVLSRIYTMEAKHAALTLKRLLMSSLDLMIGIAYLAIPSVLAYLLFWIVLGFFFLMKEIPGIGHFFSVILAFGPFLLIFGSFLLCFVNLALLFFVAPAATLELIRKGSLAKRVLGSLKDRFFSASILLILGLIPLLFVGGVLWASASLTESRFLISETSLSFAMEWFFMMIPFAAILTPFVVFFFNFSVESYTLLQRDNLKQQV